MVTALGFTLPFNVGLMGHVVCAQHNPSLSTGPSTWSFHPQIGDRHLAGAHLLSHFDFGSHPTDFGNVASIDVRRLVGSDPLSPLVCVQHNPSLATEPSTWSLHPQISDRHLEGAHLPSHFELGSQLTDFESIVSDNIQDGSPNLSVLLPSVFLPMMENSDYQVAAEVQVGEVDVELLPSLQLYATAEVYVQEVGVGLLTSLQNESDNVDLYVV
jgi:hypothetical protein